MTDTEQRMAAKAFAERWEGRGYERGDSQIFWTTLLTEVYGVEHADTYIAFEDNLHIDHNAFIDGFIPSTKILIEQKSIDKNLRAAIRQSDGTMLTPFQQAKRYIVDLPVSQHPKYVITSNFKSFLIYDMDNPSGEPEEILLKDLERDYYRLNILVDTENAQISKEVALSKEAGDIVGLIYDALIKQYHNPEDENTLKSLNALCVRIVFCLYAEDAGIFGRRNMFHDYLAQYDAQHMRKALVDLFRILDQKEEERDLYLADDNPKLAEFPYVNGGLFADENIEIPPFTDEIRDILLNDASAEFNWSEISPTIFGAVFESTLNPETRHSGGMHYTSIENIHKVIDPLFLDELKAEFEEIDSISVVANKKAKLEKYQNKLASLNFLDPACGSGNFLTESYKCLRALENKTIRALLDLRSKSLAGQIVFGETLENPIKVSIQQFYGIEINDFAVTVAKTALWIAESQMLKETESILAMHIDFLPLTTNAYIHEGNALRVDWNDIIPKERLNYIMGNPPFLGARVMENKQKRDVTIVFGDEWNNIGNLDYVSCWYKKSVDYMKGTEIRAALVSTNSIVQGDMVGCLWKKLFEAGCHIDFGYRTFIWDSEAHIKAHVHCVIVGFSMTPNNKEKIIFDEKNNVNVAQNINAYLLDADNVFIESRNNPICNVPEIGIGNKPIDDGNYLFTKEEMDNFISQEPIAEKYFKPWYGAQEFINQKPRYCLWLGDTTPEELLGMPNSLARVEKVRQFRLSSRSQGTIKLAEKPTRFHVENMPHTNFIVIPETSSEKRRYVPIGFMTPDNLCSNAIRIMPNATKYHFGILTSNVHMAWMRNIGGRLKSDYRYSKDIVYNNFPWPTPTENQKQVIEVTAQAILDARALYPNSSLADMYGDQMYLYPELLKAHQDNDIAVMKAYGFTKVGEDGKNHWLSESEVVAELMRMYKELTE